MKTVVTNEPAIDKFNRFMNDFREKMEFFLNQRTGVLLVKAPSFVNYNTEKEKYLGDAFFISFMENRKTFYQLKTLGFSGGGGVESGSLEHPHKKFRNGEATQMNFHITRDICSLVVPALTRGSGKSKLSVKFDIVMEKVKQPDMEMSFVPLPNLREKEYLFRLPNSRGFIYVDCMKYVHSYDSMRLFMGSAEGLKQIEITSFSRAKDGGTTHIMTEAGELFSPSKIGGDAEPTWKGEVVTECDLKIEYKDDWPTICQ